MDEGHPPAHIAIKRRSIRSRSTVAVMALIQLQKVVAVCLLEATKLTMDHLGKHRMEMGEGGGPELGRTLTTLYGDLRRLRDYMQRCLGAYRDLVDIDLSQEDQRLLVACCRRSVEHLDVQLSATIDTKARDWLQSRRDILMEAGADLALAPLLELPLPRLASPPTAAMRAMETRIAERLGQNRSIHFTVGGRVGASFGEPMGIALPKTAPPAGTGMPFGMHAEAIVEESEPSRAPVADPFTGQPFPGQSTSHAPQQARPAAVAAEVGMAAMPSAATAVAAMAAQDLGASAPARANQLLDPKHVRDPRLRALATLDLRALDRALVAQDHRLVAVHLASIIEATVLDHAMTRRVELGLPTTVETWDPQAVLLQLLGDTVTSRDRATVHAMFGSRNMLRPGLQLVAPMAVTSSTAQQMLAFVQRALAQLGFAASGT